MLTVSFEKEMREAFAAGQAATTAMYLAGRTPGLTDVYCRVPKTYDEWIASKADRPQTALSLATTPTDAPKEQ